MCDGFALGGLAFVPNPIGVAMCAAHIGRIIDRNPQRFDVTTNNWVLVDFFKCAEPVAASFATAIADFDRSKRLGCVGLSVAITDWALQTFFPLDRLT